MNKNYAVPILINMWFYQKRKHLIRKTSLGKKTKFGLDFFYSKSLRVASRWSNMQRRLYLKFLAPATTMNSEKIFYVENGKSLMLR